MRMPDTERAVDLVVRVALLAVALVCANAAWAEETVPLSRKGPSGERASAVLTVDGYHELCAIILEQVRAKYEEDGHTCAVPYASAKDHISNPDWKAVDAAEHIDVVRRIMEASPTYFVGETLRETKGQRPKIIRSLETSGKLSEVTDALVPQVAAAIKAGRGTLETALIDADNSGGKKTVYRMSQMLLGDPQDPRSWTALSCIASSSPMAQNKRYLRYLIFVDGAGPNQFATVNSYPEDDMFTYRGQSFAIQRSNLGAWVMRNKPPREGGPWATRSPACSILIASPDRGPAQAQPPADR